MPTNPRAAFDGSTQVPLTTSRSQPVVRKLNDVAVLNLTGSFTGDEPTRVFREQIQALSAGGTNNFVVNLSQVSYMDSSGVGALLAAFRFVRTAGGKCKFCGAPPQVVYTLKTLNLHRVFDLFEDEAAALSSF
jgi:anti-anti-sigma factor